MAAKLQVVVGARIREARTESSLSQRDFGLAIGAATRTVQSWEHGHRIPRAAVFQRIAAMTGHPIAWFYEDQDSVAA